MKRRKPAIRVVPASQAKNNFGEVLRRVYEHDETQIVERAGMPVAAIVSMSDLERLWPDKVKDLPQVAASAKRQRAARRLMTLMNERQEAGEKFSDEEVMADVLAEVGKVRESKRKSTK